MTLREIIVRFMEKQQGCVATLKQIYDCIDHSDYQSASNTVHESARTVIYRNEKTFKRINRGIYMLNGENSCSLLINGDSRNMEEIETASIDCIITDHPWSDAKSHKSGNQKHFADYNTFKYEQSDFDAKARVLKDGAYLVEFLPVESATNMDYLYKIKQMAKKAGLQYYTHCLWRNAPEGAINTGKTTKGVQQLIIFSKGKPRKLSRLGVNAYQTRDILNYEISIFLKAKDKNHQAEKPIELYEYLIEKFTDEKDVCLDQFGGSCNMVQAALNKNRFSIVYELAEEFVKKAAERFNMKSLYNPTAEPVQTTIIQEKPKEPPKPLELVLNEGQYSFVF